MTASAIVTDIEGTTSSLSFVKDVLFPYARQHIGAYVREHEDDDNVSSILNDVRNITGADLDTEGAIAQLEKWIDEDKKITPLKSLQGLLWETGYKNGDFKGHVYADAVEQLRNWHAQDIKLYVYSSGSVYAQKLLFGYTEYGDLNNLFSGYFDTNIGAKVDMTSYEEISEQLGMPAENILFLSDIKAELDAASRAGMKTYWLVRDENADSSTSHRQVKDFTAIVP